MEVLPPESRDAGQGVRKFRVMEKIYHGKCVC